MITSIKGEIWKELFESEKLYISNFGRVKSVTRCKGTNEITEKLLTQYTINGTQIAFSYLNKKRINIIIHREVANAFLKNPNNYKFVGWKNGNKKNNHVNNLIWLEKYATNITYKSGDENPATKITSEKRNEIKRKRQRGEKLEALAYDYGVSISTIIRALKK